MKKLFLLSCIVISGSFNVVYGQQAIANAKTMRATPRKANYTQFSQPSILKTAEILKANKGFEQDPELGIVYKDAPKGGYYELLDKRTEKTKTFVKAGTNGNEIVIRTSNEPLHYLDAKGKWRTMRSELQPSGQPGVFATNNLPSNVQINTINKYSSITNGDQDNITYNRELELIYINPDGSEQNLGKANWSNYTAGDDGVSIKDAWPGIDMQMTLSANGLETNFTINHSMPAYASGKLVLRDHMQLSSGLSISAAAQKDYNGDLGILNGNGDALFSISPAVAYERFDPKAKYSLNYSIGEHDVLDINVPGDLLNKPEAYYPLIIDPIVATNTLATTAVNFSYGPPAYCTATNNLTIPAATTITDVQYTYAYAGNYFTGATDLGDGEWEISIGTCFAPGAPYTGYACAGYSTLLYYCGPTTMTSIYSLVGACVPSISCTPYTLPVVIGCDQIVGTVGGACSNHYFYSQNPFVVDIIGTTTADPVAISGSPLVCIGGTTSLSDGASTGWSWSSSNPSIASVNPATGLVTGVAAGTATITYGAVPCETILVVTVSAVTPITGTPVVCIGTTTNLTDATTGGTWSTTPGTGSVLVSTSGVVTGQTGGTATVIYTYPTGCSASVVVTINTALPNITGTAFTMCQGSSVSLTDVTTGGTWTSTNTAVGTVSTTGIVTGVGPGTTTISYASSGGCFATTIVTVYAMPLAIQGNGVVCLGSTTSLSDNVTGGNWSTVAGSGSVSVAGGTVTGLTTPGLLAGTATVSYSFGGGACAVSTIVTINPVSPISPTAPVVCSGLTTSVSDAIAGTWTSSNTTVATIGSTTGFIVGLAAGTSTIVVTYATGCNASVVLTVNLSPVAISGTTTLCYGNTTTFLDGTTGGTWTSSNTSIATIISTSGTATAVSTTGGVTTIAYTMPITGCNAVTSLTVNPVPAPIQGNMTVCTGLTTTLTDPTTGGGWLSSNTTVGPIGSASGIVTGQSSGTTIITYTIPSTGCSALAVVTVNSSPVAIEGNFNMCVGFPTQLSDPSGTGTWTSTNTAVGTVGVTTGVVSPQASGTTTISYILASGCNAAATITVNPVPAAISGTLNSCAGYFTPLSDASGSGNWSSSNTLVATINSSTGLVYAVATGTSTIEYAFTSTGCYTSAVFTVNPSPVAISGTPQICQGLTATFNDPTPGGIWSSSNTTIGSVGSSSGIVQGVTPGSTTIIYTLATSCFVTYPVTITTPPTPINGPTSVCHDYAITLTDGTTPGTWNVTPGSGTATISGSGVLTGGNSGVVTVSYTTPACNTVTYPVLINPLPAPITGIGNLCVGSGTSLTDATLGGTWSSSNSTATVSSTGVVSGVDTGSGTYISYTLPTGCYVVAPVVVFPIPAPIQGVYTVCPGSYVVLSDITPGGAWSSSNGTIAYSIAFTGRVEGVVAGTVNISYTLISGCYVTVPFTVENPLPASLTVTQSVDSPTCAGSLDILTAIPVNGGTPTFEWENWGSYIGNTNPYPFVPTHGDYITCIMTTHDICASPAVVQTSVVLNIYPVVAPQVVITTSSSSDTAGFLGEVYTFYTDVTYGGVNPSYQWNIDGAPVSGATNSTFTTHIYENNELISVTVTGTSPCDTPMNTNVGVGSIEIYGVNYLSASSLTAGSNDLSLFPNPNTGNFILSGTLSSTSGKDVTLEITDMVGRTVYTGKTTPQNGTLKADINLGNDIATGTYLLRVYTESGTQTFHFVVGK